MPLIKLETIHPACKWALWEVTESFEELVLQLDLNKESEDIAAIKNEFKKREKAAGRLLLKKIMDSWEELYVGTVCDIHGKPFLKDMNYYISLSHSHGCVVAIIDKKNNVGIDIELIKNKISNIASRVFSQEEITNAQNVSQLVTLWCIKESLYKLHGKKGLNFVDNIKIPPFVFDLNEGKCKGEIISEGNVHIFDMRYLSYKNFIITYTLNH